WRERRYHQLMPAYGRTEKAVMLSAGALGGTMTGLVGNGIDIVCFSVMVLLFRLPEKVSTPTSVILMAVNSLVGFLLHLTLIGDFTETVKNYWLAAVPVVVVGAPLGAFFCTKLSNKTIAVILIVLIVSELISSLCLIPMTPEIAGISLTVFVLFSLLYYSMSKSDRYQPTEGSK
ncbi:MAG: sulfite exporter TauE/SafE family protein, partial [Gammaproteobacteria bacterium]